MKTHELAKELMNMPNIEVLIPDGDAYYGVRTMSEIEVKRRPDENYPNIYFPFYEGENEEGASVIECVELK